MLLVASIQFELICLKGSAGCFGVISLGNVLIFGFVFSLFLMRMDCEHSANLFVYLQSFTYRSLWVDCFCPWSLVLWTLWSPTSKWCMALSILHCWMDCFMHGFWISFCCRTGIWTNTSCLRMSLPLLSTPIEFVLCSVVSPSYHCSSISKNSKISLILQHSHCLWL